MKVAVIQLNSTSDKQENLKNISDYIKKAAKDGAELVSLPEYCNFMGRDTEKIVNAEKIPDGETTRLLVKLAMEYNLFVHVGSIVERYNGEKSYNTSYIVNPDGKLLDKYRKIHLFDIEIEGMPGYKESDSIQGGTNPVMTRLPFGNAGLSICYDLRFAELYRNYATHDAKILFIPAAFTRYTGMLHWENLLRARAIENQCYVVAAGQFGKYLPEKECYGNSMIIDPWGTVVARASEGEGIIIAELREELIQSARESIPCLKHRKPEFYDNLMVK
ncbi:carbon-nitrogen hydrolase family protein [Virgibacillus dakarensis]|uniref:carbon-nitrogen hydrolase family protein n=1 Tax=Virgibacillus dakarensis TaxID=1917889 RepID=UPI000B42FE6A|nr:carbon-nitrogen hydrolase family protein [Virgibacillus dakarensis]